MPKDTFFNLPEAKRKIVLDAAIDEFAEYPFSKASVGRIIERAGIASGSFYQYFEDKLDLYSHIMQTIQEKKMKIMYPIVGQSPEKGFFELFRSLYEAGIRFLRENPKLEAVGGHFFRDKELLNRHLKEYEPAAMDFYRILLIRGIKAGDIREDLDLERVSYFLFKLGVALNEYIFEKGTFSSYDTETVDSMLEFIRSGIGK